MNTAEKVFEAVKALPEQQAAEVLDFVEHLKAKQTRESHQKAFQELDAFFKPYQVDMSGFRFDRDDANAR